VTPLLIYPPQTIIVLLVVFQTAVCSCRPAGHGDAVEVAVQVPVISNLRTPAVVFQSAVVAAAL
jgi:hypothetical protein